MQCSVELYAVRVIQTKKRGKRNAKALILEREAFTGIPILHEGCLVKKVLHSARKLSFRTLHTERSFL